MTTKVIVTGPFSTGKTHLIDNLSQAFSAAGVRCETLPDVARACPLPLNTGQREDATLWLIASQLRAEIDATATKPEIVLCDRGIPDILAHYLDTKPRFAYQGVEIITPFLKHWLTTYDLMLFSKVDHTIPIKADGLRDTDPQYRVLLEQYAIEILHGFPNKIDLPFAELERVDFAYGKISRLLNLELE